MPKKIPYSAEEIRTIFAMKQKGYVPREIAEKLHRSTKAIAIFIQRYKPLGVEGTISKIAKEHAPIEVSFDKLPANVNTNDTNTKTAEPVSSRVVVTREKKLSDFSARELIKNLYDRGYRIENNELICLIKQKVQLKEILAQ